MLITGLLLGYENKSQIIFRCCLSSTVARIRGKFTSFSNVTWVTEKLRNVFDFTGIWVTSKMFLAIVDRGEKRQYDEDTI
jgi:hypothetical protein